MHRALLKSARGLLASNNSRVDCTSQLLWKQSLPSGEQQLRCYAGVEEDAGAACGAVQLA